MSWAVYWPVTMLIAVPLVPLLVSLLFAGGDRLRSMALRLAPWAAIPGLAAAFLVVLPVP